MSRCFVVVAQRALASDEFRLDDLPSSSGRLDVPARCIRAALLTSHGVRRDTRLYLVLLGGPRAPRVVRVDGATAKYLRPDERALAVLLKKVLASRADEEATGFVEIKPGIALARGGVELLLGELGTAPLVLEEGARDLRGAPLDAEPTFFLGDHLGFDADTRARLAEAGARPVAVGPLSLHTEDVLTLVQNELDRRAQR